MVSRTRIARPGGGAGSPTKVKGGFIIWLSGADLATLQKCPSERGKFTGVGGVVLTTAVMAAVSFAFALHTGAHAPLPVAIGAALFWGLAIMNLDRWLVTATHRRERWYQNLVVALPRFVLAIIIGAVISTPLVLWIFQSEIEAELKVMQAAAHSDFQEQLNNNVRLKEIPELQASVTRLQAVADGTARDAIPPSAEIVKLRSEFEKLDREAVRLQDDATDELDGDGGTRVRGEGPVYKRKQALATKARTEANAAKKKLDTAEATFAANSEEAIAQARESAKAELTQQRERLNSLVAEKRTREEQFDERNERPGILARLDALSSLTSRTTTLQTAYLALLLFITAIEVLPVLVKFLMSLGPPTLYDRILADGHQSRIEQATKAFDYERQIAESELKERLQRENEAVPGLVKQMVDAEREVYEKKIGQWRETELGDAPTTYPRPAARRRRGAAPAPSWPTPSQRERTQSEEESWE
ncbi:protein of unknown function [Micromonospora pallida]|uniref:DUF4407 domain-containing protein n=1 Tax=Micromonospora pallida TaxID=145854 RepID=A0A1C6SYY2_9ACTN|nr:DUF4407 domain-containing protein [Micromonospora pallida]SCL34532.1 protein of unknown function [Micromonospora pallida]